MVTHEEFKKYQTYLKSLSKKDLVAHAERQMMAISQLEDDNQALKQQASRSNAQYLSSCRSVGGVTLPPGV